MTICYEFHTVACPPSAVQFFSFFSTACFIKASRVAGCGGGGTEKSVGALKQMFNRSDAGRLPIVFQYGIEKKMGFINT